MRAISFVLFSVLLSSVGQVLFKQSMLQLSKAGITADRPVDFVRQALCNSLTLVGIACYSIATIAWLAALNKANLNYVYPFAGLTYVLVILASRLLFQEPLSQIRLVGIALVAIGVVLVFKS